MDWRYNEPIDRGHEFETRFGRRNVQPCRIDWSLWQSENISSKTDDVRRINRTHWWITSLKNTESNGVEKEEAANGRTSCSTFGSDNWKEKVPPDNDAFDDIPDDRHRTDPYPNDWSAFDTTDWERSIPFDDTQQGIGTNDLIVSLNVLHQMRRNWRWREWWWTDVLRDESVITVLIDFELKSRQESSFAMPNSKSPDPSFCLVRKCWKKTARSRTSRCSDLNVRSKRIDSVETNLVVNDWLSVWRNTCENLRSTCPRRLIEDLIERKKGTLKIDALIVTTFLPRLGW